MRKPRPRRQKAREGTGVRGRGLVLLSPIPRPLSPLSPFAFTHLFGEAPGAGAAAWVACGLGVAAAVGFAAAAGAAAVVGAVVAAAAGVSAGEAEAAGEAPGVTGCKPPSMF